MSGIVRLEAVAKTFGDLEAVKSVDLSLGEGEAVALVGHNGAGKSTLIKIMLGLLRPTSGVVRVLGDDPARGQFAGRARIGYLPEHVVFNAALTGREALAFYARLKRRPMRELDGLMEQVGIAYAADRRIGGYSKGMRQRLGLAQALLGEPRLLLLDEPTTGLDPALRQSFYEMVEALRGRGVAVLLSSHALDELEGRVGRVVILDRGVKVADGALDDLRAIARLDTKIRVRLEGAEQIPEWMARHGGRRMDGRAVEIRASPADKMDILRRLLAAEAEVADIEVVPPTLDEVYAHFLRGRGAG